MIRFLTLVVLALALVSTQAESRSKRLHITVEIVDQTFTGDPTKPPQLGDQLISSVKLFDIHDETEPVGTGSGFCTVVAVPPLDTRVQCLLSAVFAEGQIIFGGLAPLPEVGGAAQFGILGGTEKFRKARGVVTIAVLSDKLQDAVFELE